MALSNKTKQLVKDVYDSARASRDTIVISAISEKDGDACFMALGNTAGMLATIAEIADEVANVNGCSPMKAVKTAVKCGKKAGLFDRNREED